MYAYNSSIGNVASGNTFTLSPPTGALIIVFSVTSGGGGTPTVTFSDNSGSTWANASNNVNVGGLHYSVGYCLSALAGVTTITATFNGGTPGTCNMAAIAYTGMVSPSFVTVAAPNSQASPGTGTNAIVSNAVACGSINALFVGFSIDITIDNVFSAGTGFTARYANDPNSLGMVVIDPNAEVTGTNTALWTTAAHGTDTFVSLAVAFADNSVPPNSATIAWVS